MAAVSPPAPSEIAPSTDPSGRRRVWRGLARWLLTGVLLLAIALAALGARAWSLRSGFERLDDAALRQLDLYAAVLEHELAKQDDLPGLLDVDGDIEALLAQPTTAALRAAASRRLTRFTARAGMVATEVVDPAGRVLAASEGDSPGPAPGRASSVPACAAEALAGGETRHFASSAAGAPEVCLGRAIRRDGQLLGAVLVRMSLAPMEATWIDAAFRDDSERPFVTDQHGRIILSATAAWKGRTLREVAPVEQPLSHGAVLVRLGGAGLFAVHERPLARLGWRLHVLTSTAQAWRDARTAAWGGGAVAASAALLLVVLLQRRRVIAQKLAAREALQRANDQLELKVRQRTGELERSNAELRQAHEELVQAGKLALLGQMSAGISHELGQPLTALRGLAGNARVLLERSRMEEVAHNLQDIADLVERMGRITAQLRSFARKSPAQAGAAPIRRAVDNARQLVAARLAAEQVAFVADVPAGLAAHCDGTRLEQVLVNLFVNALDAMAGCAARRIEVAAREEGGRVLVRVSDSGPGIAPAVRERLFEPFFTTKPVGEGMGLGLVISQHIVHECGGALRSVPAAQGAAFEFDLPVEEHALA